MSFRCTNNLFFNARSVLGVLVSLCCAAFSFSTCAAQVKGAIKITLFEGGGNAAAYGFVGFIGPAGRTQSFTCPSTSYGDYPTGRTVCSTTYGSSSATEWQPGDTLTVFSFRVGATNIPLGLSPSGPISCSWDFKGWSGPCTGMGVSGPNYRTECTFTLPMSGDVDIGALFSATNTEPCPALPNIGGQTPTPSTTPTPSSTPLPGDKLVTAMNDIADELADRLQIKNFLRDVVAKVLFPKLDGSPYEITVKVTASGEGTSGIQAPRLLRASAIKAGKKVSIADAPLIAKGRIKTSSSARKTIEIDSTKIGRKVPLGRNSLEITITVSAIQKQQVVASVVVTKILSR